MSDPAHSSSQLHSEQECSILWGSPSSPKNVDSFSAEELAEFYKSLECVVCHELPPKGEVKLCVQKHLICLKCAAFVTTCPLCSSPISGKGKAFTEECLAAVAALPIPCKFKFDGCPVKLKVLELTEHMNSCIYRNILCIMSKCDEKVPFMQLFKHLLNVHGKKVNGVLNCSRHIIEWWIEGDVASTARWPPFYFTCFNNVFLYMCVSTIHGTWEWVWILANNEEAKRFRVETKMENPDKVVSSQWKGPVHSIRKPLKQIITSGEVFVTNSKEIRNPFIYRKAQQQTFFWRSSVEIIQILPPIQSSVIYIRTEEPVVENTRENFVIPSKMQIENTLGSAPSSQMDEKGKIVESGQVLGNQISPDTQNIDENHPEVNTQSSIVYIRTEDPVVESTRENFVGPSKMQIENTPKSAPPSQMDEKVVVDVIVESGQVNDNQIPPNTQNMHENHPEVETQSSIVHIRTEDPVVENTGENFVGTSKMQIENTPKSVPPSQMDEKLVINVIVESDQVIDNQIPLDTQNLSENLPGVDGVILILPPSRRFKSGEGMLLENISTTPQDGGSDDERDLATTLASYSLSADSQTPDKNQPQDGASDVELDFATTQTSYSLSANSQTPGDNQPQDGGSDVELDFATTQTSYENQPNTKPMTRK